MIRNWPLRRRLVVAIVALLAVMGAIIGTISVVAVSINLTNQLDARVIAATTRSQGVAQAHPDYTYPSDLTDGSDRPPDDFYNVRGQALGTVIGYVQDGVILGGYVDADNVTQTLSADQLNALGELRVGARPVTIDLGGDLGDYRLAAAEGPFSSIVISGLPLADVQATVTTTTWVVVVVCVVGIALAALVGFLLVGAAVRPLRRVIATASEVAGMKLDRGEVALSVRVPDADTNPKTEVGQVGMALNQLLTTVGSALTARQQSEDKVRHFVADASHELRTPLASIRGYAELTRRTGQDLPPEAAHSLDRIESESIRMTSLVEDLLLLARLDSRRELENEPVELSRLLVDVVSDAHVAGSDHRWLLDLPDEPVTIHGDEARLHQVFVNLLANARVHTPPGTEVTVALESVGTDRVAVTVTDNGPGIPEEIQPTMFERFVRGDTSRFRGTGSTGLGLSIVHAVVEAHSGVVSVESEPGRTVFRVELPL